MNQDMDGRKIVVVVEDVEAARTALQWALHNFLRYGDFITLLHVFSPSKSRNRNKMRLLRLHGYQLALSFKDICNTFFNTNIEIIVTEGDEEGGRIAAMVREIGAFALVVGLHDQSFLYRWAMVHNNVANFNCKILAIKQPAAAAPPLKLKSKPTPSIVVDTSTNLDFSQIEISRLEQSDVRVRSFAGYLIFLHQKLHIKSALIRLLYYGDGGSQGGGRPAPEDKAIAFQFSNAQFLFNSFWPNQFSDGFKYRNINLFSRVKIMRPLANWED